MKNDNITKWADELDATDAAQTKNKLCLVEPDGTKKFCCLGFGSTLVPDLPVQWPMPTEHMDNPALFGEVGAQDVAPREFMEWLGYTIPASRGDGGDPWQWDVFPDWPADIRHPHPDEHERHPSEPEREGILFTESTSLANLNDEGFTFKQIADIIRHFGLRDSINNTASI